VRYHPSMSGAIPHGRAIQTFAEPSCSRVSRPSPWKQRATRSGGEDQGSRGAGVDARKTLPLRTRLHFPGANPPERRV